MTKYSIFRKQIAVLIKFLHRFFTVILRLVSTNYITWYIIFFSFYWITQKSIKVLHFYHVFDNSSDLQSESLRMLRKSVFRTSNIIIPITNGMSSHWIYQGFWFQSCLSHIQASNQFKTSIDSRNSAWICQVECVEFIKFTHE